MKTVKVGIHLTLHAFSLRLKFPATAFLQLQLNQLCRQIVENCELTAKTIVLNKEVKEEVDLLYNCLSEEFEPRKMNIVILIKTKNNPNKLTAGLVEIELKSPHQQLNNIIAKPLKCNDQNAFLQYSLQISAIAAQSARTSSQRRQLQVPRLVSSRTGSIPKIASFQTHYNHRQINNPQHAQQNLTKKLSNSRVDRSRSKPLSTQKYINKGDIEFDQSKTQKRSYDQSRSKGLSKSRRQESNDPIKQLNMKYQAAKIIASQAEQNVSLLSQQNNLLRQRIKQLQSDLSNHQATILKMNKKTEIKQTAAENELRQVKNKLEKSDTELRCLIAERNNLLNSLQSKEKQWLLLLKQKERAFTEDKREVLLKLEQKQQTIKQANNQLTALKQKVNLSQVTTERLTDKASKLQEKFQDAKNQADKYRIELQKIKQEVVQLQRIFNNQIQDSGQIKNHRKLIQDLQKLKEESELLIKQKQAEIQKFKIQYQNMRSQLKSKNLSLSSLNKKLQEQNNSIQILRQKQKELIARTSRYEGQLKNEHANLQKIEKHAKQLQSQLNKITIELESTSLNKVNKTSETSKTHDVLNKKYELLAKENFQLTSKCMDLTEKLKLKEDELFQLGEYILRLKQNQVNLQIEVQNLREDSHELASQTRLLDQREEEINKLREQIDYKDKIMEDMEHQYQLRYIQFNNDIKLFSHKVEQRQEQIKQLNEYVGSLQKKQVELEQDIQNLEYALKNKQSDIEYIKHDFQRERKANIALQERTHLLTAAEHDTLASVQHFKLENLDLTNTVREHLETINTLHKRYDTLFEATVSSLQHLVEFTKNGQNTDIPIIKHPNMEISTLLNQCVSFIEEQRKNQAQQVISLQRQLADETQKIHQNTKLIEFKTQTQFQLKKQLFQLQQQYHLLLAENKNLQDQILQYQRLIKDRESKIRKINLLLQNSAMELTKKEELLHQKEVQIDQLNQLITSEMEKWKAESAELAERAQSAEKELIDKLSQIAALEHNLKTQMESVKLLTSKNDQLQVMINQQSEQIQVFRRQANKQEKQLVQAKEKLQLKSELIKKNQAQIEQTKMGISKLSKEKQSLLRKQVQLQETYSTLVQNRNHIQTKLRIKQDKLLQAVENIKSLQQMLEKLQQQNQHWLRQHKQQIETITQLTSSISSLKRDLLLKQNEIQQTVAQKESIQKQLKLVTEQKQALQQYLQEFQLKQAQICNEHSSKYNVLISELDLAKDKIRHYAEKIEELNAEIAGFQAKISNLTLQMTQKLNFNLDYNFLGEEKRKEIKSLILQLKRLRNAQKNKSSFLKIPTHSEHERGKQLNRYWRELTLVINQMKIKMNRMNISSELKVVLLEDVKLLQIAYQNICKCSVL